jgi:hypothetical protein
MDSKPTFAEVVDAVDALPDDEQEELLTIIQNRRRERRREQLLKNVDEAREEYDQGQCRAMSVDDIMREIRK